MNIDANRLAAWLEEKDPMLLVDVRTPAETVHGVIEGARLLPLHLLPLNVDRLRDAGRVVIYCHSGARSAQACHFLAQHGIEACNLMGGVMMWQIQGKPMVPPAPDASLLEG
jgi:rhodanese-related sulfurtransferase